MPVLFASNLLTDGSPLINSSRQQRTIAGVAQVEGFGYWSGQDVCVEFRPAPPDTGIRFFRSDADSGRCIPALVRYRVEVPRRTSLREGGIRVDMVEHVLAALAGLQIDNCEIWVDHPEMPGCDGSSQPFVTALDAVGTVPQAVARKQLTVRRRLRVGDPRCWVEARPASSAGLMVECHINYGSTGPIRCQSLVLAVTPESFRRELAAARTFVLEEEAAWMRQQGLGARVTCRDLLVFDDSGPIDNPLRFPDECVRHKTLDLIGDLALAGYDLSGHFVAHCSGHRLNAELVAHLLAEAAQDGLARSA
jgi:UDP-3-O-[3-hydroxymyristoyl] N-acetylglucosamine deacetylase